MHLVDWIKYLWWNQHTLKKKWLPGLDSIAFLAQTTFDQPTGNFNSNLKVLKAHHFMSDTHLKILPKMIWSPYILISKYISDFCLSIYSGRLLQFVKYWAEMKATYPKPFSIKGYFSIYPLDMEIYFSI